MNEMINPGVLNPAVAAFSLIVLVVGLIAWFFVNRASVRANRQIALLEAQLDQQKRQTALLRRLCEASEPASAAATDAEEPLPPEEEFVRLVAER